MLQGKVICITAIDTDVGKTIATGLIGRFLLEKGYRVITQKICQTGCTGVSQDILLHRKLMGMDLQQEDVDGLTCPYVFQEPCSPHLAARLENAHIDCDLITASTRKLASDYDYVLLEGVGGLMVPLQRDYLLADYLAGQCYTHLLVSCARLGSINHTLSALEIMKNRKLNFQGIIYNRY
ncbi:MAG: dethiobiotin synthase, partial [Desulfopila sp.]|nr:dethiobiotin synthase [Desulfopila sp.]